VTKEALQVSLKEVISRLKDANYRCTFLGVGPVSETVVTATFEACGRHSCPPIFIASRNQVDLESLGHGYLMGGMDQHAFVRRLESIRRRTRCTGAMYICRDHGGPWQRNVELDEKYPVERAMDIAKESFRADIEAGFNCLHVDATKCPFPYTQKQLCERTVELVGFCEEARRSLGRGAIDYEVGTEDIKGGLTTADTFESFLREIIARLTNERLPLPTFVVAQTGTLTRADRNVGRFDRAKTSRLASIAAALGVGFKEHNGDYLSAASCRIHPDIGVTGMNVAPEFGLVETDALLELADLEMKLVREGWIVPADAANLRELLGELTFAETPWRKWMTDDVRAMPREAVESDAAARTLIARVCGHYTYGCRRVRAARKTLRLNVERFALVENAGRYELDKVRDRIEFYIRHFRLTGVNALWPTAPGG